MSITRCKICSVPYERIERDCAFLYWGKIEYIESRDLRIITQPSSRDYEMLEEYLQPYAPESYTLCKDCVECRYLEIDEREIQQLARDCFVEVDDILEDPESFGITFPMILPGMWRVDFEPDTCSCCEHPFEDNEVIAVVQSVDLLNGEPIDVEESDMSAFTFLCKDCGGFFDV